MMSALAKLSEARKRGMKPAAVMITLYPAKQPQWWRDGTVVEIVMDSDTARADFRPLIGCHVVIVAEERSERLRKLTEKVQQYAQTIAVLSSADPDELGYAWGQGKGWRRFGAGPVLEVA